MNDNTQTLSIENLFQKAISPWLSYLLAPLGYCLIGVVLALRQQQFHFWNFTLLFCFFIVLYLQEIAFNKLALHPERKRWMIIGLTNLVLLIILFFLYRQIELRIVLLLLATQLINHLQLFPILANERSYIYTQLLNVATKYYLLNFVTVFALTGQVTTGVALQLAQFIFFGLYVSHTKHRLIERKEGKIHYSLIDAIFNIISSLSFVIGTILYYIWYLNQFNILGIILFSLSLLIPILYQIYIKKAYTINGLFTYLHWYLVIISILYGCFIVL